MNHTSRWMRSQVAIGPRMPWWRVRMVWLVLAGPASVEVAGLVTAWIAVSGSDTLVSAHAERFSDIPAVQGRNHAASQEGPVRAFKSDAQTPDSN